MSYAGHDVLEVSLEWMYGAITFLTGPADANQKSEHISAHTIASLTHNNRELNT